MANLTLDSCSINALLLLQKHKALTFSSFHAIVPLAQCSCMLKAMMRLGHIEKSTRTWKRRRWSAYSITAKGRARLAQYELGLFPDLRIYPVQQRLVDEMLSKPGCRVVRIHGEGNNRAWRIQLARDRPFSYSSRESSEADPPHYPWLSLSLDRRPVGQQYGGFDQQPWDTGTVRSLIAKKVLVASEEGTAYLAEGLACQEVA